MANHLTHILLLRHGQTDANASGVLQGHLPVPLNLVGIRQANLLANRLAGFAPPLERLISSDLFRATQTAAAIATACGLPVVEDSAWRERSFGLLEGKPVGSRSIWEAASGEIDPPGAEPTVQMHRRVREALLSLPRKFSQCRAIAVVTHGGPLRSILKMFADGRLASARGSIDVASTPTISNAAIMHLMVRPYPSGVRFKVLSINDDAHLLHSERIAADLLPGSLENPAGFAR